MRDNVYYDSLKYGLVIFGELQDNSLSWEFSTAVVWEDPEKHELYCAFDTGCSCPTPFENHTRDDLIKIARDGPLWDNFQSCLNSTKPYYAKDHTQDMWNAAKVELEAKVLRYLRDYEEDD